MPRPKAGAGSAGSFRLSPAPNARINNSRYLSPLRPNSARQSAGSAFKKKKAQKHGGEPDIVITFITGATNDVLLQTRRPQREIDAAPPNRARIAGRCGAPYGSKTSSSCGRAARPAPYRRLNAAASSGLRAPCRGCRASGSRVCERAGREEREGIALSGCGSPGSWQTVCGDVTPEFQTMINMIICIKFEWVLVFRENASDDECS